MQDTSGRQSPSVTYDIVIATRNRPDALRISLPLILAQSQLPGRLIIVDSSDDHAAVARAVAEATAGAPVPVILEHAEPCASRQRNLGLRHVTSDIAFMPDDDSLLYPGASAAIMAVYARDTARQIAGVSAVDCAVPPPGALPPTAYRVSTEHRGQRMYRRFRHWLEKLSPGINPFRYVVAVIQSKQREVDLSGQPNCVRIGWILGYLMSYRTEYVRAVGFEERFKGYSLFEDSDLSLAMQRFGCLVATHDAQIYHHRHPGGRPKREAFAAMAILNRAYVLTRQGWAHGFSDAEMRSTWRKMRRHTLLRMGMLGVKLFDARARRELRVTLWAYREMAALFRAAPDTIGDVYSEIRGRVDLL